MWFKRSVVSAGSSKRISAGRERKWLDAGAVRGGAGWRAAQKNADGRVQLRQALQVAARKDVLLRKGAGRDV